MIEDMRIPAAEVKFSNLSFMDVGRVFQWEGKLFRAIRQERVETVRRLFSSGLIDALVKEKLLVRSNITEHEIDGYGLIVEHEMVRVVSYPREWTFSMLKDASLVVLRVNEISSKYGYQITDCHGYNILFLGNRPVYIDLGSFSPIQPRDSSLQFLDEFLRSYYYPIEIWASLGAAWGTRAVPRPASPMDTEDYLRCRWPIFRWRIARAASTFISKLQIACSYSDEMFEKQKQLYPHWKIVIAKKCRSIGGFVISVKNLRRRIQRIRRRKDKTQWSDYHDSFTNKNGEITLSPHLQYVVDLLASLNVQSILEIAGNQGILARTLKKLKPSLLVTCTDADESAIDKGFCASRVENLSVNWAVLNPFFTELHSTEDSPVNRFQADAVVVLALSHHLVLTRGLQLDWVLNMLAQYSGKYILIEFMPLGLYVAGQESPSPPAWYNIDWFKREFEMHFDIINCIPIEENRILFFGCKKQAQYR